MRVQSSCRHVGIGPTSRGYTATMQLLLGCAVHSYSSHREATWLLQF